MTNIIWVTNGFYKKFNNLSLSVKTAAVEVKEMDQVDGKMIGRRLPRQIKQYTSPNDSITDLIPKLGFCGLEKNRGQIAYDRWQVFQMSSKKTVCHKTHLFIRGRLVVSLHICRKNDSIGGPFSTLLCKNQMLLLWLFSYLSKI